MTYRTFLEEYPLYRKFEGPVPDSFGELKQWAIHVYCPECGSGQTFNTADHWEDSSGLFLVSDDYLSGTGLIKGEVVAVVYQCSSCRNSQRTFLLRFGTEGNSVTKVGQDPPWDISVDPTLENFLGDRTGFYKKGLICESQSYGIGAFSYYRRIVEEIIDDLLDSIADFIGDDDREGYLQALKKAKKTHITQHKIDLVKDLLPPILRPSNMNPLSILHTVLSKGVHQDSDESCLELAEQIRKSLEFLVTHIATTQTARTKYSDGMRRLLQRRRK